MESWPRFSPHELQKFAIAIVMSGKTERRSGRGLGIKYQYLDFSPAHSTEEAYFYGGGSFLRRRLISTEEAYFYGGGSFLRRMLISTTEEAYFYGGGLFLRGRLISTEEAYFYGGGSFVRRRLISIVGSFVGRRSVSMQQPHISMENKTHRTEQASFNTEMAFFLVYSSGPSGPP